jgi:hypothetical protein
MLELDRTTSTAIRTELGKRMRAKQTYSCALLNSIKFLFISFTLSVGSVTHSPPASTLQPSATAADTGIAATVTEVSDSDPPGQLQTLSNQVSPISFEIDANREDWSRLVSYALDSAGDGGGTGQIDWASITMAHDCRDLYVRYRLNAGPAFVPDGYRYNLYVDVDRNRATGFRGRGNALSIGADILIQGVRIRSRPLGSPAGQLRQHGAGPRLTSTP